MVMRVGPVEYAVFAFPGNRFKGEIADAIAELFASQAREHWLRVLADKDLPVAAVHDLDAARSETILASAGLLERFHGGVRGGEGLGLSGRVALRDADVSQMLSPENAAALAGRGFGG